MQQLEIIGHPRSSCTRTARMAAIEKGVDYTLTEAAPHSEAAKAVHPAGKIPSMRHGDVTLFETLAITYYIDHAFDGPALHPANPLKQAKMYEWISFSNDVLRDILIRRIVLQYFFPQGDNGQPDQAAIDAAVKEVPPYIEALDTAYGGKPYLLGDEPCLADFFLAPVLYNVYATPVGEQVLGKAKNIEIAADAMKARESFIQTMPPIPKAAD